MCCQGGTTPPLNVPLTSIQFKAEVTRGHFAKISEHDVTAFEKILGKLRVCQDPQKLECHNVDVYGTVKGQSKILLMPKTTEEISAILKYCNQHRLAVTPQGGNTSLVGGSVPVFDEIILSTNLMTTIYDLDKVTGILRSQAGVTLRNLNEFALKFGFIVPLDLAPDEFCQIGGNLATNAGGLRYYRYGSLHSNVMGLEVVLANGAVLDMMSCLKKDNTGYDLKQILIGSEGTLGIITQVAIQCHRRPKVEACVFLGTKNFEEVITAFRTAQEHFQETLTCVELMDCEAMKCVEENTEHKNPLKEQFEYFVLLEIQSKKPDSLMAAEIEKYLVLVPQASACVAITRQDFDKIWALRRSIGMAILGDGYAFKYDFSIPLDKFPVLMKTVRDRVGNRVKRCCCFGHLGDSNIHLLVTVKEYTVEVNDLLQPFLYEWVNKVKGSVSAEHGIGFKERKYLKYSKSEEAIEIMQRIKIAFDPQGILNPYKIFLK